MHSGVPQREILMLQPAHQSNGRRDPDKKPAAAGWHSVGDAFALGGESLGPDALWKGALQALNPHSHLKVAYAPRLLSAWPEPTPCSTSW